MAGRCTISITVFPLTCLAWSMLSSGCPRAWNWLELVDPPGRSSQLRLSLLVKLVRESFDPKRGIKNSQKEDSCKLREDLEQPAAIELWLIHPSLCVLWPKIYIHVGVTVHIKNNLYGGKVTWQPSTIYQSSWEENFRSQSRKCIIYTEYSIFYNRPRTTIW